MYNHVQTSSIHASESSKSPELFTFSNQNSHYKEISSPNDLVSNSNFSIQIKSEIEDDSSTEANYSIQKESNFDKISHETNTPIEHMKKKINSIEKLPKITTPNTGLHVRNSKKESGSNRAKTSCENSPINHETRVKHIKNLLDNGSATDRNSWIYVLEQLKDPRIANKLLGNNPINNRKAFENKTKMNIPLRNHKQNLSFESKQKKIVKSSNIFESPSLNNKKMVIRSRENSNLDDITLSPIKTELDIVD